MKYIVCDVCKKTVERPIKDRTLFHHAHIDICQKCQDELDWYTRRYIRKTEAEHRPFDFQWYDEFLIETLNKAIKTGHIEKEVR